MRRYVKKYVGADEVTPAEQPVNAGADAVELELPGDEVKANQAKWNFGPRAGLLALLSREPMTD
jgi:hypothetical protein